MEWPRSTSVGASDFDLTLEDLRGCTMMKRHRPVSSSESSDECPSTSFTSSSMYRKKSKNPKEQKKSAEVFRKDLISAMKIPDSHHVNPDSYYLFTDTWKEEWEKGVQVPANPDSVPTPSLRSRNRTLPTPQKPFFCSLPVTDLPHRLYLKK